MVFREIFLTKNLLKIFLFVLFSTSVTHATVINLYPGDNLGEIVSSNPPGTSFIIKSGVHRRQSINPKDNMIFTGESGAILDGENVTEYAFETLASIPKNVTIQGLIIQNYIPPLNLGAIQADNGADWLVQNNEIRNNANIGLKVGARMRVLNNFVHHNGVSGINGYRADGVLLEGNEVSFNNPSNTFIDPSLAGESGVKFFEVNNLVARGNNIHDNNGIGIWCDTCYLNQLIENNTLINNIGGVWQEIGYSAIIRNNIVSNSGVARPLPGWLENAGIMVTNSPDVEIYGNTLDNNANGITAMQSTGYETSGLYGPRELKNLYVHNNTVTQKNGLVGLSQIVGDNSYYTSKNNRFVDNTYYLGISTNYFTWSGQNLNESGWKSAGQDVNGVFNYPPKPLVGDLDLNHIVNTLDWSIMNSKWFTSDATADLNKDGKVNTIDFSLMNANWGKTW